jgi:hypothetical protein
MPVVVEVESRFTGMFFLLRRLFPEFLDGRLRPSPRPDMGFATRRPRDR